jgi:hypothetical protein
MAAAEDRKAQMAKDRETFVTLFPKLVDEV